MGTVLLHLPVCSADANPIRLLDCLFTATSAVCVTGLSVLDVGKQLSGTGQAVLLLLIQVGGLGILILSNWLLLSIGIGRTSPEARMSVEETYGSLPRIQPLALVRQAVSLTLLIEGAGALLLVTRFRTVAPFPEALWLAVFHSVSAFCNAGFSLFHNSLSDFRPDFTVNLTVIFLIFTGGIGFLVLSDLKRFSFSPRGTRRRLSIQTRVVLIASALLIVVGAVCVWGLESTNTLKGMGPRETLLSSVFLSVTCRTAGFNTVDTGALRNATLCILMILMGIGASPGSTGGGIKTTTAAVLAAFAWSRTRGKERIELMGRSIPLELVAKSVAAAGLFAFFVLTSVVIVELVEIPASETLPRRGLFLEHVFESVSALGTVGLSTGITPKLQDFSLLVLVGLMFAGRLGPLLIANSLIGTRRTVRYSLPEERFMVG